MANIILHIFYVNKSHLQNLVFFLLHDQIVNIVLNFYCFLILNKNSLTTSSVINTYLCTLFIFQYCQESLVSFNRPQGYSEQRTITRVLSQTSCCGTVSSTQQSLYFSQFSLHNNRK